MTRPTLHLTNWSSPGLMGPGRRFTIMAIPRAWERGAGRVETLVPARDDMREAKRSGDPVPYLGRYLAALSGFHCLPPGKLTARPWGSDGWIGAWPVADGDTLCCSCARHAPCHRRAAALVLLEAGWDVVLDGDRLTMGPDPRPSAHDVFWSGTYRGTDADPRETGWCETCGREVYDGDSDGHRGEP